MRKQIWGAYFVAFMAEAITKIQSDKVDNASPTGKMNRAKP